MYKRQGPDSLKSFQEELKECKSVIWNGPMGVFEMEAFNKGTFGVCDTLANLDAITIIGGGDSVAAVEAAGLADKMSHISTGGGASLELLEGLVLPGVAALDSKGGASGPVASGAAAGDSAYAKRKAAWDL